GKADLDFLEPDLYQLLEKPQLAFDAHGFDQRLVDVAQVGAHPDGRLRDEAAGPGALGEVAGEGCERYVFGGGVGKHQYTLIKSPVVAGRIPVPGEPCSTGRDGGPETSAAMDGPAGVVQ